MKRLGFFAVSLLILIGVYAGTPVYAATVTIDQLIKHAEDGVFQENIYALNNEKTAINSKRSDPNYQTLLQMNTAEMAALIKARTAFENTLLQSNTGKAPEQLYSDGLLAAASSLQSDRTSISLLQQPHASQFIDSFKQQLTTEAANQEWIKAITTGQTLSDAAQQQANATKSAANPSNPANKDTGSTCTLFPIPTLGACINEAFAWFIRNTILRVAGVFLWLAAQLLNYSIDLGILQFKTWAPDALYSVWIVVRQIISLAVVFAGLWLGFMYIVGREDTFGKYIGWLVMFALFVNFSYPVTRALIDVSNIVSLNVYTSAVGPEVLSGTDSNSAGTLIMNRLGLNGLLAEAEKVDTNSSLTNINSTPNVLMAVIFVIYAAYIFFVAAGLMIARTAVLVFLTVASPLLLIDSIIPKLGDAAMKMRELYFKQLVVAPVFMILFALTLKFMDIFSSSGAFKGGVNSLSGGSTVVTFFNIIMMLVMLHIMLKVTRSISGQVGQFATNALGKVGGFGLAAATGGTGVLARGSIGAAAARLRDSDWLKNAQDSRFGRGLYGISNSLAQSTFDARNIGLVNRGASMAGLTGMGGLSMQKGIAQNYDQRFKSQEDQVRQKLGYIASAKDQQVGVRDRYLNQMTRTPSNIAQKAFLNTGGRLVGLDEKGRRSDAEVIKDKLQAERQKIKDRYDSFKDEDKKREFLESQSADMKTFLLGKEPLQVSKLENIAQAPTENVELAGTGIKSGPKEEEIPAYIRKQQAEETQMNPQIPPEILKERQEAMRAEQGQSESAEAQSQVNMTDIPAYQRRQATETTEARALNPNEVGAVKNNFDLHRESFRSKVTQKKAPSPSEAQPA